MSKCYEVDKAVVSAGTTNFQEGVMRMVLYQSLQLLYTSEIAKRQGLFLTRHGLLKQFFEEDDKERGFLKDLKP